MDNGRTVGARHHRLPPGWRADAFRARAGAKNPRCVRDLGPDMVESPIVETRDRPMEAEQLNLIANTLADLKNRSAEMRRYL